MRSPPIAIFPSNLVRLFFHDLQRTNSTRITPSNHRSAVNPAEKSDSSWNWLLFVQSSSSWPQFIRWIHKRSGWKIFCSASSLPSSVWLMVVPRITTSIDQAWWQGWNKSVMQDRFPFWPDDERGNDVPEQDQREPFRNGRDLMVTDSMVATAMAIAKMKTR